MILANDDRLLYISMTDHKTDHKTDHNSGRTPEQNTSASAPNENLSEKSPEEQTVDPRDLVRTGGYSKDPREIVEHPGVTPQMLDEPQNSRAGLGDESSQTSQ